jgi:hypothetical protein
MQFNPKEYLEGLISRFSDKQSKFIKSMLNKDHSNSQKIALELYTEYPQYLLFNSYLNLDANKRLIISIIRKLEFLDPNFIFLLIKSNKFTYEELLNIASKNKEEGTIKDLIDMHMYVLSHQQPEQNGHKYPTGQSEGQNNTFNDNIQNITVKQNITDEIYVNAKMSEKTSLKENLSQEISSKSSQSHDGIEREECAQHTKSGNSPQNSPCIINEERHKVFNGKTIDQMIDILDDFTLYDLAIRQGVNLRERNSINYKWYRVILYKDLEAAKEIIKISKSFEDIRKIISYTGFIQTKVENIDILLDHLEIPNVKEENIQRMFCLLQDEPSLLNVKILFSLLISTKKENNIFLALYLSYKYKFQGNYEIDLIHLFLNRYFMFNKNIQVLLRKMEVKNIQIYNLAYIWSDPMIISNRVSKEVTENFIRSTKSDISLIACRFRRFLDANRIGHATSLYNLKETLEKSLSFCEIYKKQILATNENTMFSNLLGEKCSFIFNKATVDNKNVYLKKVNIAELSKNAYLDVNDAEFLSSLE